MKDYFLVLEVPDDFDPENLGIELDYPEEILVKSEGELDKLIDFDIEVKQPAENSVAIFKCPAESIAYGQFIMKTIEETFGIPTIGVVDDINLLIESPEEATKMLEGMLEKVKSAAIRKKILQK